MQKRLRHFNLIARIFLCGAIIYPLFLLMHWPFVAEVLIASTLGFVIFYSIYLYLKPNKKTTDYLKFLTAFFWVSSSAFSILHLPYASTIKLLFWGSLIAWRVFKNNSESTEKPHKVSAIAFSLAIVTIIIGSVFKLMHWPGASLMLIIGYFFIIIWIVAGAFNTPIEAIDEIDEIGKS